MSLERTRVVYVAGSGHTGSTLLHARPAFTFEITVAHETGPRRLHSSGCMSSQTLAQVEESWDLHRETDGTRQILEIAGDINRKLGYA